MPGITCQVGKLGVVQRISNRKRLATEPETDAPRSDAIDNAAAGLLFPANSTQGQILSVRILGNNREE